MKPIILALAALAGVYAQTAKFPAAVVTIQDLGKAKDASSSTLNGGINNSALTVVVADGSQFTANQIVQIDSEQMQICSIATNTLTICTGTRGFAGTSAASHLSGAAVRGVMVSWYINALAAEVVAIAGRVLPARAATSAPGTCVANKDLFVDTDDLTLSVCNATGDGWNAITSAASSGVRVCATGGTSTAYTCTVSGSISTNDLLLLVPHTASGATPTLNVNSGGAVDLYRRSGNAVGSNYLAGGSGYLIRKAASTWVITEQDITAGANGTLTCTNGVCDTTALVCITTGACAPTGAQNHSGAATTAPFRVGTSDPATCDASTRQFFYNTTSNVLKVCNATNTWTNYSGSGGGNVNAGGTLTSNAPVIGAGSTDVSVGSRSGNTTEFATVTGTKTTGKQLEFDASGNVKASATDIGAGSGGGALTLLHQSVGGSTLVGDGSTLWTIYTYAMPGGTVTTGDQLIVEGLIQRGPYFVSSDAPVVGIRVGDGGGPNSGLPTIEFLKLRWEATVASSTSLTNISLEGVRPAVFIVTSANQTAITNFNAANSTTISFTSTVAAATGDEFYPKYFRVWRIRP